MPTDLNLMERGINRILEHHFKGRLKPADLELIKLKAASLLRRAFQRDPSLTLRFYDKQAPSHKILKVTPAPEHEKDRNR